MSSRCGFTLGSRVEEVIDCNEESFALVEGRSTVVWNCDGRCSMVAEHVRLTAPISSVRYEKPNLHHVPGLAVQLDI